MCIRDSNYTFEKMFSGGYFGGLCLFVLKAASKEGLFSGPGTKRLNGIAELTAEEANSYVSAGHSNGNILVKCFTTAEDREKSSYIIDSLIDRTAKLVAAN